MNYSTCFFDTYYINKQLIINVFHITLFRF
jgi:hypothetical protein